MHNDNLFFADSFLNYYAVNKDFTKSNNVNYYALPAKVNQQTQMIAQQMFTSFFALTKKATEGKYDKPVRLPKYLPKDDYFVMQYEKDALSFKENSYVSLSQTSIKVKTNCLTESITMVHIKLQDTKEGTQPADKVLKDKWQYQ